MATQGGQANKTGGVLEGLVIGTLSAHGFAPIRFSDYAKSPEKFGNEVLLRNAPYTTLYGGRGYTEFLLVSQKYDLRTRIECKWQQKAGSVDEKLPYLYLSCVHCVPEDHIIILIDGAGFREGAVQWLRSAAAERRYMPGHEGKRIVVMGSTEFLTWCNETFR
jgi:hypothetical protein